MEPDSTFRNIGYQDFNTQNYGNQNLNAQQNYNYTDKEKKCVETILGCFDLIVNFYQDKNEPSLNQAIASFKTNFQYFVINEIITFEKLDLSLRDNLNELPDDIILKMGLFPNLNPYSNNEEFMDSISNDFEMERPQSQSILNNIDFSSIVPKDISKNISLNSEATTFKIDFPNNGPKEIQGLGAYNPSEFLNDFLKKPKVEGKAFAITFYNGFMPLENPKPKLVSPKNDFENVVNTMKLCANNLLRAVESGNDEQIKNYISLFNEEQYKFLEKGKITKKQLSECLKDYLVDIPNDIKVRIGHSASFENTYRPRQCSLIKNKRIKPVKISNSIPNKMMNPIQTFSSLTPVPNSQKCFSFDIPVIKPDLNSKVDSILNGLNINNSNIPKSFEKKDISISEKKTVNLIDNEMGEDDQDLSTIINCFESLDLNVQAETKKSSDTSSDDEDVFGIL